MKKRLSVWILIHVFAFLAAVPAVLAQGAACSWGISSLRGDAVFPPGWEKFGGALDIRHPYVKLHLGQSGFQIKGFEFQVRNITTTGEDRQPNPLIDGLMTIVASYLPADVNERVYLVIPHTEVFERGGDEYFQAEWTPEINDDYVHIVAEIDPGDISFSNDEEVQVENYLPPGVRDLTLMVILDGSFGVPTPTGIALGGFRFDHNRDNHTRLAYLIEPYPSREVAHINTVIANGKSIRQVTGGSGNNPWYDSPAWSRDGKTMALSKRTCNDIAPTGVCINTPGDPDSTDLTDILLVDLTSNAPFPDNVVRTIHFDDWQLLDIESYGPGSNLSLMGVDFSPQNDRLAMVGQGGDIIVASFLLVYDLETGVWNSPGAPDDLSYWLRIGGFAPAWHPHSEVIAVNPATYTVWSEEHNSGIMYRKFLLIDALTDEIYDFENSEYFDAQPAWSPDGEWLAFISNRDGSYDPDLWVMDRDGNHMRKIFDCRNFCTSPTFSPDGLRIAFNDGHHISSVDIWGNNLTTVTSNDPDVMGGGYANLPDWSPFLDKPEVNLVVENAFIENNEEATLTWTSSGGYEAVIEPATTAVGLNGSLNVSPDENTVYKLSVTGIGGTISRQVKVVVKE